MATANPPPPPPPPPPPHPSPTPLDSTSNPEPDTLPPSDPSISSTEETAVEEETVEGEGEEEEEECGFCLFMKGGGCKESFIAWEKCVEEAEKTGEDVVEKCFEVTSLLKKCMDAHADYYEPILRAEQAMADSIANTESDSGVEVEKEKSQDADPGEEKVSSAS
ncbi:uncharacterized protein [Typha latifolia]|uniref:uncharacterized protein n=1 Tax=Typha latifolia TaxID=4733 RepID=UPI003C2B5534